MGGGLFREQEAGADPRPGGAEREHRRQPPPVDDAAGRQHGDAGRGIDHRGHERQRRDLAPDVAARFPALRHQHVDAGRRAARALPRRRRRCGRRARRPHGCARRRAPDRPRRRRPAARPRRARSPAARSGPIRRTRLTPKGRSVRARVRRISAPRRVEIAPGEGEHAQPAGVADGGRQLRRGGAADRRLDDRQFDAEQVRERRPDGHAVCLGAAVAGSPVFGVPTGSIRSRHVSSSATGRCSTPRGTT